LTARGAYSDGEIGSVFDNWVMNLAGSLTGPIFEGRRRLAEVRRAEAEAKERVAAYRDAILRALQDVEDALMREQKQAMHLRALREELDAAELALAEAHRRYAKGATEYLSVLLQMQDVQRLQRSYVQQQGALIVYRISLHRALGGGWADTLLFSESKNMNGVSRFVEADAGE
jgi:outer membrane protein TolC